MNPILARFTNDLTLVSAESQAWFESCVAQAATTQGKIAAQTLVDPQPQMGFWPEAGSWMASYRPYVVVGGVLQIPVQGVLLNNFPYQDGAYATGYEYIAEAMKRGMDDEDVKGIALVIDSPGGMVSGNFDLVDKMFAMRGQKPIKAFAADSAYSAAYSIASAADTITVARSGGVGSVGVVTTHVDMSGAMEARGVKVTFIYAGKHKVDGNPYEPLPTAVKGKIQERIDALYSEFVSIVARNRNMSEAAVRKTEAATFMASEAIENGLADEAGSFEDAFTAFQANVNSTEEDDEMAEKSVAGITEEALATAVAAATDTATKAGAAAEKARIVAILGSDVAKDRPTAAMAAALDTDMTADQVGAFLAKLPVEKAEAAAPAAAGAGVPAELFKAAMNGTDNPDVGAIGGESKDKAETDLKATMELVQAFGLPGFKSKE